jgi:DNA invertase Pin-like site-specific DNA recombinase
MSPGRGEGASCWRFQGEPASTIAAALAVSRATVYRVLADDTD